MTEIEEAERPPAVEPPRQGFWRTCVPTRLAAAIVVFTCLLAPAALVVVHIHENPMFSPIDEPAHWDYVTRLANGGFPRLGQPLQASTLRAMECRGTALHGLVTPPCGTHAPASAFPGGGFQYEAQQPPTYYLLTVPMRWAAMKVLRVGDLTATRLSGIVWLVAGLLVLWAAGRMLDLAPTVIGAGTLLVATAPLVVYQSSYVSNDAAGILAGSLVLLLGVLAWKRSGRWMWPVLAAGGFFVASLKLNDVFPVVVVSFLFGLLALREHPGVGLPGFRSALRWWWPRGGALLLGGAAAVLAWLVLERRLSLIDPRDLPTFAVLKGSPVGLTTILREAVSLLQPLTGSYAAFRTSAAAVPPSSPASLDLQAVLAPVLSYVLLAGGLSGLFVRPRLWCHWLGLATVPALYLGGVVLGISLHLSYGIDPGLSGRYGMALAPMLVLATTAAVRGVWVVRGLWLLGLVTFALSFYFMLAA